MATTLVYDESNKENIHPLLLEQMAKGKAAGKAPHKVEKAAAPAPKRQQGQRGRRGRRVLGDLPLDGDNEAKEDANKNASEAAGKKAPKLNALAAKPALRLVTAASKRRAAASSSSASSSSGAAAPKLGVTHLVPASAAASGRLPALPPLAAAHGEQISMR